MILTSLKRSIIATGRVWSVLLVILILSTSAHADGGGADGSGGGVGAVGGPASVDEVDYNSPEPGGPGYDETSVFINVQRIGGVEMPAVIKNRMVYLPVTNVFDFLKIKNTPSLDLDSVTGFFIDPTAVFCIDNVHDRITYLGKVYELHPDDMIRTDANLYLKQEFFSEVFGLMASFDFSNLTVKMNATFDLPAVREMQLEQMHQNVQRLKGDITADTFIRRTYPAFSAGNLDWSLTSTQRTDGTNDLRASLGLGALIAGGEANVVLNVNKGEQFNERAQFYQWRLANNDFTIARQLTLGRIITQSTSSIFDPVVGVQVTNTPTTYRRSFGTYKLSKITQPGWTVELYVNNIMVDFTKADASGFFSFDVPLVYGNSIVKLRYYGPYGEVRTVEENITIPFNFLPKNELEYTVSAGLVEDGENSKFARASVNYGLNKSITVGGGMEYLSSVESGPQMPFVNTSLRITSNLMLSGQFTMGVAGKGMLSYRMPGNAQFELNYTKYVKDQKAIIYNYQEERKLAFTMPFRTKSVAAVTRLMVNQIILTDNSNYTTAEWLVSGTYRKVSANINTYMINAGQSDPPKFDPYFYSNVSLAYRFNNGLVFTPQAQYSYKENAFISVKADVEKFIFNRGYVNVSYEQNFKSGVYSIGAGFRYDLPYARVGVAARKFNDLISVTESASGSVVYDPKTNYTGFNDRPGVGRAGITILPFLDLNGNGHRDEGEQKVAGLRVRISSGRIDYSKEDTVVRLFDLEPYNNYFIDISQNSFETIGWQVKNKTMSVAVEPNQFKLIEVPVVVMSEADGTVSVQTEAGVKGQGRISVCFYRADGSLAGCTTTEPDGYYNFMGLIPGEYTVRPDAAQLKKLNMSVTPASSTITVLPSREGGLIENNDFTIKSNVE
jgi:hypothetical protein